MYGGMSLPVSPTHSVSHGSPAILVLGQLAKCTITAERNTPLTAAKAASRERGQRHERAFFFAVHDGAVDELARRVVPMGYDAIGPRFRDWSSGSPVRLGVV